MTTDRELYGAWRDLINGELQADLDITEEHVLCPFCGCEPFEHRRAGYEDIHRWYSVIVCSNKQCGASGPSRWSDDTGKEAFRQALEAWNEREPK